MGHKTALGTVRSALWTLLRLGSANCTGIRLMRISLLVPDLSANNLARTYPIAKVLERRHDIQVVGPLLWAGKGIYEPYRSEFDYTIVRHELRHPWDPVRAIRKITDAIDGDVVYAFKPVTTSLVPALLYRRRTGAPVVVDIEDWDAAHYFAAGPVGRLRQAAAAALCPLGPYHAGWRAAMERMVSWADDRTVASRFFQERFGGGHRLVHGTDTDVFDPARHVRQGIWQRGDEAVVLFTGVARPHKGVVDLANATAMLNGRARLVIVGPATEDVERVVAEHGDNVLHVGSLPHSDMPRLLAEADIVALPNHDVPYARGQVPLCGGPERRSGPPESRSRRLAVPLYMGGPGPCCGGGASHGVAVCRVGCYPPGG